MVCSDIFNFCDSNWLTVSMRHYWGKGLLKYIPYVTEYLWYYILSQAKEIWKWIYITIIPKWQTIIFSMDRAKFEQWILLLYSL